MKYNEDKILKEIDEYIKSTYGEHYSCRYGKKNGHNRADLLKAVHYVILLLNYDKEKVK